MEARPGGAGSGEDQTPALIHWRIIEAKVIDGYRIWMRFADGVEGLVDLSWLVGKGVFSAWEDPAFFRLMRVDPEANTVVWPGRLDLAPDALYERVAHGRPLPSEEAE